MARREALSKWLESAAAKRIKQEIDQADSQVIDIVIQKQKMYHTGKG